MEMCKPVSNVVRSAGSLKVVHTCCTTGLDVLDLKSKTGSLRLTLLPLTAPLPPLLQHAVR